MADSDSVSTDDVSTPPYAAHRSLQFLALCLLSSACGSDGGDITALDRDGSFGSPANPTRDAGLDGGSAGRDGGLGNVPTVHVRFVHAIPNLGPLLVCHDPDGSGPLAGELLRDGNELLRADYGTRSNTVLLPALSAGALTLQRDLSTPAPSDAGLVDDAGALDDAALGAAADAGRDDASLAEPGDAGVPPGPCDPSLREATIPLPITGAWLAPSAPVSDEQLVALDLLPGLSGASALSLLGSGVALDPSALDQRAEAARVSWLSRDGGAGDTAGAERAATAERDVLEAAFGARALIQLDRQAAGSSSFSLSVFHALPDVAPAISPDDPGRADREVGAVRLCVTAGSLDSGALPKPPLDGARFRVRTLVGEDFEPGLNYDFRVFAQGAFDDKKQGLLHHQPVASGPAVVLELHARPPLHAGRGRRGRPGRAL